MSNQNILVVDDDKICAKVLETHLNDAGFHTDIKHSNDEAWDTLSAAQRNYAVILLDRLMLNTSGVGLVNKIKSSPALRHIPVIMITAQAERDEVIDAVRAGVFDFVYKPVDADVLLPLVHRAINLYSTI